MLMDPIKRPQSAKMRQRRDSAAAILTKATLVTSRHPKNTRRTYDDSGCEHSSDEDILIYRDDDLMGICDEMAQLRIPADFIDPRRRVKSDKDVQYKDRSQKQNIKGIDNWNCQETSSRIINKYRRRVSLESSPKSLAMITKCDSRTGPLSPTPKGILIPRKLPHIKAAIVPELPELPPVQCGSTSNRCLKPL